MVLNPAWHYHFLGIGGVSMSALAEVLHRRGISVSGSDAQDSETLRHLAAEGIAVTVGHASSGLDSAQAVVYSTALREDHDIRREARRRNLPEFHRAQVLGALTREGRALTVTGTHGKTTSTACLAVLLEAAGWDPTALVGGHVPQFGGRNLRLGGSRWLVAEADESDGSFTGLSPWAVLLTNVEADHLDQHGSLDAVVRAFGEFLACLPEDQPLVYCADDPLAAQLAEKGKWRKRSFGMASGADVQVGVKPDGAGGMEVSLQEAGREHRFASRLAGRHNALNMAGAFALALEAGVPVEAALRGLAEFRGVARRQQYLGQAYGCRIFDDYAHHPTEIRATLDMFQEHYGEPLTVVFQPHLYSRTAYFAAEFAEALRPAQRIYVTDIYGAREEPIAGVSSRLILDRLSQHPGAFPLGSWDELAALAQAGGLPPGLLVTMGAGDITGLGPRLLQGARKGGTSGKGTRKGGTP